MKSKLILALVALAATSFAFANETKSEDKPAVKTEKKDAGKDCCCDDTCAIDAKPDTAKKDQVKPAGAEADTHKK